jgi:hypothetical protein
MNTQAYSISPARYAKGKFAVRANDGSGYKCRAAHLAEALGGRWTHRDGGYLLSQSAASDFEAMINSGWHGRASWYRGEPSWFSHSIHGEMSRRDAVKLARKEVA